MRPAPRTAAEFVDLVDATIFKMQDLTQCAEDDIDDELSDLVPTFNTIEHALKDLRCRLGRRVSFDSSDDLPFMRLARACRHVIPFSPMLDSINRAHQQGVANNRLPED